MLCSGRTGFSCLVLNLRRATWSLGKWDKFAGYVAHTEEEVVEGSYLRAVMALKNDDFVGCTK